MNARLLLAECALVFALPVAASAPLAVKITPTVAPAPAYLIVRATVDSSVDNRALEVVVESADYFASSRADLDGDRAPRTTTFAFSSLPPGKYEVTATLIGPHGSRGSATSWFQSVHGAE